MAANHLRHICGAAVFLGLFVFATASARAQALAYGTRDPALPVYNAIPDADEQPSPALQRQVVPYAGRELPGTIIVDPAHTFLYLTLGGGKALRYGIGVGREGFEWSGSETIARKAEWPDWIPPAAMVARQPYLPRWIGGGPGNPLGARALYLGNTDYRIHGTNDPTSIGKHMSSGCIRMLNADIIDLYSRVDIGTHVIVLPDGHSRQITAAQTDVNLPPQAGAPAHVSARPLPRTAVRVGGTLSGVY